MNAELYREILHEFLFPFIAEKYDFKIKLHQDNDPKHTSKICKAVITDNDIEWVVFLTLNFFYLKLIKIN